MTLRIVAVDDAVPGNDWSHTVPGKYLYDVTGITAVLNGASSLQALDASGNGNDGAYTFVPGRPVISPFGQPGAIPEDDAIGYIDQLLDAPRVSMSPLTTMAYTGDFSIEWWTRASTGVPAGDWFVVNPTNTSLIAARYFADGHMELNFTIAPFALTLDSAPAAVPVDDAWHHYVWSYVAAVPVNSRLYRDAVSLPLVLTGLPVIVPATIFATHFDASSANGAGGYDEVALYPVALSAGQVAAHYAARGAFDAYSAAVLADAPAVYYHLDEVGGPGGRQAALEITDGTNIVELIPTGYAVNTQVGTTTYSWQPRLQARARSSDGTLLTVPTPELHLPAGYTVGTLTPDLGPDDQWTGIIIWWDDAYQTAQQAADSYLYAPGAHLVYQQVKAG